MSQSIYTQKVMEMRKAFDRSFALPLSLETPDDEHLLAIRISGDAYALRVREIAGLAVDRKIRPLPTLTAAFLGLAGIRGGLVPAWSLPSLLGYGSSQKTFRWLAVIQGEIPCALAFEEFEKYCTVPVSELRSVAVENSNDGQVWKAYRFDGAVRKVVHIHSIFQMILKHSKVKETKKAIS